MIAFGLLRPNGWIRPITTLAHVENALFVNMGIEKSHMWPLDFLSAIRPGAGLEPIKKAILIMVLRSVLETFDHEEFPQMKAVIDGAIALWQREDIGSRDFSVAAEATATAAGKGWADSGVFSRTAMAARTAGWAAKAAIAENWVWPEAVANAATRAAWSVSAKSDYFADELLSFWLVRRWLHCERASFLSARCLSFGSMPKGPRKRRPNWGADAVHRPHLREFWAGLF